MPSLAKRLNMNKSFEPESLSILIVDDDPFQRRVVGALLRDLGVRMLFEADNGSTALALLRQADQPVDLTICDLEMPEMDGVEFLSQLGTEHPGLAVFLASSMDRALIGAVESMATSNGLRVLGGMQKPVAREPLMRALAALKNHRARKVNVSNDVPFTAGDIKEALALRQFVPFFQPKIDINSGELKGVEALVRWKHPELGLVAPIRFIPLAEECGLIGDLTWSMLDSSMTLLKQWLPLGLDVSVSVNITVSFLEEIAVTENIVALAEKHNVPANRIMLEVTESMASTDLVAVVGNLVRLRMRGFGLSIDDFGTGYASMQQLSRIPFSELKVDRSFVAGASQNSQLRTILESSVQLGKRLGLTTIAEGVETMEELDLVRTLGCDIAQGYYFARPMPASDFVAWAGTWTEERLTRPEFMHPAVT